MDDKLLSVYANLLLEKKLPVPSFFRDMFFKETVTFDTESVRVQISDYDNEESKYINREDIEGNVYGLEDEKYIVIKPPYIKFTNTVTLLNIQNSSVEIKDGMNPIDRMATGTLEPRKRARVGRLMKKFDERLSVAEEIQCASAIIDGKVTLNYKGGHSEDIDMKRESTSSITLSGTSTWDGTGATIKKNIDTWRAHITEYGKVVPTTLIMGIDAFNAFIKDDDVRAYLDNRRFMVGNISIDRPTPYSRYYGDVYGYDIYTDESFYIASDGTTKHLLDPKTVIMCDPMGVRGIRNYGAISNMKAIPTVARRSFADVYDHFSGSGTVLTIESAPLMTVINANATFKAKVLA